MDDGGGDHVSVCMYLRCEEQSARLAGLDTGFTTVCSAPAVPPYGTMDEDLVVNINTSQDSTYNESQSRPPRRAFARPGRSPPAERFFNCLSSGSNGGRHGAPPQASERLLRAAAACRVLILKYEGRPRYLAVLVP